MFGNDSRPGIGLPAVGAFVLAVLYHLLDSGALPLVPRIERNELAALLALGILIGVPFVVGYRFALRIDCPTVRNWRPCLLAIGGCGFLGRVLSILAVSDRVPAEQTLLGLVILGTFTGMFMVLGSGAGIGLAGVITGHEIIDRRLATVSGFVMLCAAFTSLVSQFGTISSAAFEFGTSSWFFTVAWFSGDT